MIAVSRLSPAIMTTDPHTRLAHLREALKAIRSDFRRAQQIAIWSAVVSAAAGLLAAIVEAFKK